TVGICRPGLLAPVMDGTLMVTTLVDAEQRRSTSILSMGSILAWLTCAADMQQLSLMLRGKGTEPHASIMTRRLFPLASHGRRHPQACLLMAFLRAPTIAVRIAPPAPPPTSCPITAPRSTPLPVAPWRAGRSSARSCPPPTPPRAPAMVFPAVPRLMFCMLAPAALPPMLPAMSWRMRLMMVADTGVLLALGHPLAAANAGTAALRLPWAPLLARPRATPGHGAQGAWAR